MEQVGFFLLLWLIVAFLVSLGVGKIFRETSIGDDKSSIPVWRVERRIQVRRARDRGVQMPWHEAEQRHGSGRRRTDRPRWRRGSS